MDKIGHPDSGYTSTVICVCVNFYLEIFRFAHEDLQFRWTVWRWGRGGGGGLSVAATTWVEVQRAV